MSKIAPAVPERKGPLKLALFVDGPMHNQMRWVESFEPIIRLDRPPQGPHGRPASFEYFKGFGDPYITIYYFGEEKAKSAWRYREDARAIEPVTDLPSAPVCKSAKA